jgi:hypothetical protein
MSVTALPDLNVFDVDALKALIVTQHERLLSTHDQLTATREQLLSRENEIEHLKLLIASFSDLRPNCIGPRCIPGQPVRKIRTALLIGRAAFPGRGLLRDGVVNNDSFRRSASRRH